MFGYKISVHPDTRRQQSTRISKHHASKSTIMTVSNKKQPYFGLTGKWLTYWITFACSVDMLLFGYDQAYATAYKVR